MTYKQYKQLFDDEKSRGLMQALRAPVKRGWSSMTRQSIPSKNDVIRACNTNLSMIAEQCAASYSNEDGYDSLLKPEVEEKIL